MIIDGQVPVGLSDESMIEMCDLKRISNGPLVRHTVEYKGDLDDWGQSLLQYGGDDMPSMCSHLDFAIL